MDTILMNRELPSLPEIHPQNLLPKMVTLYRHQLYQHVLVLDILQFDHLS